MLINAALLAAINTSYNLSFNQGRGGAPNLWQDVADEYPSDGPDQIYPFMMPIGQMRDWIGEKEFEDLAAFGYRLANGDFEKSIAVDRNDVEDDRYGIYNQRFVNLGFAGADLPNNRVQLLLEQGKVNLCWDKLPFFSATHPIHPLKPELNTGSNLHTGSALTHDNLVLGRSIFRTMKGPDGIPIGVEPDSLLVHSDDEIKARELVEAAFLPGNSGASESGSRSNVLVSTRLKVRVLERSSESGVWYLASTKAGGRAMQNPLIVQKRKAPVLVVPSPNSEAEFRAKKLQYSVEARYGFGYGMWQQCHRFEP